MHKFYNYDDEYMQDLESEFSRNDRQARRKRNKKVHHVPKKTQHEIIHEIADPIGIEGGFTITYNPSKHESGWLLQSLEAFYFQALITDVMAVVKGGKEASVYRCQAHPTTGHTWLAAKVYRPRQFRQLRNDAMYREGRQILGEDGKPLNERDWRALRAMNKGSSFGQRLEHTSWLMYEYRTLQTLHKAGASVPEPIAASENAVLMSYLGDGQLAAPTLSEVHIRPEEARPLFEEIMRNIHLMLRHGMIHGDLSAFNILYWEGDIVIIDFPQVVDIHGNQNARNILHRDVVRVCEYFQNHGLRVNAERLADQLWQTYGQEADDQDELLYNILAMASFAADNRDEE
jgi:RIO kinase 1